MSLYMGKGSLASNTVHDVPRCSCMVKYISLDKIRDRSHYFIVFRHKFRFVGYLTSGSELSPVLRVSVAPGRKFSRITKIKPKSMQAKK